MSYSSSNNKILPLILCLHSTISLCLSLALPAGCVSSADSRFDVDVSYFKRTSHMNADSLQRKHSDLFIKRYRYDPILKM